MREFEVMRGDGVKRPADSEQNTRINNRKSIVLSRDLAAGAALTESDIAVKRPGYGIAPKHFDELIGRILAVDMEQDAVLTWDKLA